MNYHSWFLGMASLYLLLPVEACFVGASLICHHNVEHNTQIPQSIEHIMLVHKMMNNFNFSANSIVYGPQTHMHFIGYIAQYIPLQWSFSVIKLPSTFHRLT